MISYRQLVNQRNKHNEVRKKLFESWEKSGWQVVDWVSGEVRIPNQPPPYNDDDQPVFPK